MANKSQLSYLHSFDKVDRNASSSLYVSLAAIGRWLRPLYVSLAAIGWLRSIDVSQAAIGWGASGSLEVLEAPFGRQLLRDDAFEVRAFDRTNQHHALCTQQDNQI